MITIDERQLYISFRQFVNSLKSVKAGGRKDQRKNQLPTRFNLEEAGRDVETNLSGVLYELRHYHDFTQEDVAKAIGVHRSTYAYYEKGKVNPPISTLVRLSRLYAITLEELLDL